jgi:hypothetical protein
MHIHQFIASAPSGEAVISHEHSAAEWFTIEAYVARQLTPPTGRQLPDSSLFWLAEMRAVAAKAPAWIERSGATDLP